jgi:heme A synthase
VALALPVLVATQVMLGIATIWTLKEVWAVTLHLFVAALLLACCSWLWARASAIPAAARSAEPRPQRSAQAARINERLA